MFDNPAASLVVVSALFAVISQAVQLIFGNRKETRRVQKAMKAKNKELKELMIRSGGKDVAQKVIEIALNDEHPHQLVALKMCLDRTLPVSMFEKDKSQRSAVTINITGLGEPTVIETDHVEDVEDKYGRP